MELELQHQMLEGYRPVFSELLGQEETLESIVPDFCPDMARIVSASGTAFLKEKEVGEGTLRLTGTVCVTILYIPDGEELVRALEIPIPFQCIKDCPQLHDGMPIRAAAQTAFSDAKILNPRKLLVRSSLTFPVTVYGREKFQLTCDVNDHDNSSVEKQFTPYKSCMIAEAAEKVITFSDVLRHSASKPAMEELLYSRAEVGAMEAKLIGKKLVCKGDVLLTVLYRSEKLPITARFELPYSQIIDLVTTTEEGEPELTVSLRSMDCHLRDGDLEVTVEALAQGVVWVRQPVTVVSDVYCTSCSIDAERILQPMCTGLELNTKRESARQFCQSGIPGKQVLDCFAAVRSITAEGTAGETQYTAQVNVDILYLSEDDALCGVNYTIPVTCSTPVSEGGSCNCACRPIGEVTAVPVTGGLEVRFETEFRWAATQQTNVLCVNNLKKSTASSADAVRPSVVIRMVGKGDSLWEIAKACGSTVKDICAANSLPSETAAEGTLLLIPTKRA